MPSTILKDQSILLPTGDNSTRPATPSTGMTRYNTQSSVIEYYNGTSWVGIGLLDGSTNATAAPSAAYIKTLTGTSISGTYWIKNTSMTFPVQVYCDMSYDGGGYMLLAYGYVSSSTGETNDNQNIPNLNHDGNAYSYNPTSRATSYGMISTPNSQKSALLIAKACTTFLMAAGSNPSTGGIDSYSYVYKFPIPSPSSLTFNNFGPGYNGSMNTSTVTVTGLKGDVGSWTRYTLTQSLGATWNDSYPSGYGAIESSTPSSTSWNTGPFFPSIQAGSRTSGNTGTGNAVPAYSSPDIGVNSYAVGSRSYAFRGWYSAGGNGNTGQTSIWVK